VLDPFAVAAIRLLVLTGARLREILHARWENVDFERGIIHLPDSKTGKKPIYLSAAAHAVLANLSRLEDNPFVIPSERRDCKAFAFTIFGIRSHPLARALRLACQSSGSF
jgi:integrase